MLSHVIAGQAARWLRVLPCITAGGHAARWLAGAASDAASADAKLSKAQSYKERQERERQQQQQQPGGAEGAAAAASDTPPPSRLAAEYDESLQAYFMSAPSGLGALAENRIRAAIKEGALEDLMGKGKPLASHDHDAQFYRVDPLMQAMSRTMGAQSIRPESLERRDTLILCLKAFRHRLLEDVRRAVEAQRGNGGVPEGGAAGAAQQAGQARGDSSGNSSGSSSGGGSGGGFFSQLMQQLVRPASLELSAASSCGGRPAWSLDELRAGRAEAHAQSLEEANQHIRKYNSAVLQDKETYGAQWPLNQHPLLTMAAEVDRAFAELERKHSGG